jgi:hypothetical protein
MTWVSLTLAILTAGAGLIAATYWYRSSTTHQPDYDKDSVQKYELGMVKWMRESSRLNCRAAGWTAGASILVSLSAVTRFGF